jgi:hypothetical protein
LSAAVGRTGVVGTHRKKNDEGDASLEIEKTKH